MSSLNRRRVEGVIVLLAGYLLVRAFWIVSNAAGRDFDSATIEATVKIVLWTCGALPIALWLARRKGTSVATAVGFDGNTLRGLAFGLICTLPMFAALLLSPRKPFDPDLAFGSGVLGPFAEELLFRGFLFGVLWRVAGWSVPAAILASSVMFGLAHVPNVDLDLWAILRGPSSVDGLASTGSQVVLVIPAWKIWWQFVQARGPATLMTALPMAGGGAVLAWIAYRWRSLWPAVAMHGCMNLWWDLTRGEHFRPALGPDLMSIAQLLSVGLAVAATLRFSTAAASGASSTSAARSELTLANDL